MLELKLTDVDNTRPSLHKTITITDNAIDADLVSMVLSLLLAEGYNLRDVMYRLEEEYPDPEPDLADWSSDWDWDESGHGDTVSKTDSASSKDSDTDSATATDVDTFDKFLDMV